jgi:maltokinase
VIDLHALQSARWFAGKHRRVATVSELGAFALPGAPAPALRIAEVIYDDGGRERYLLPDEGLRWGPLLRSLSRAPLTSPAGRVELRAAPALRDLSPVPGALEHVPSTDQSNTLVVVGERLLVKAYRKLEAGTHPEVELGAALVGAGAPVPAHAGSLHHVAADGTDTAIALLQEFVGGAVSGWEAPIEALAAHLRAGDDVEAAAAPYAEAGTAAAALHAALRERFGVRPAPPGTAAAWRAAADAALDEAIALDPRVVEAAPEIRARLAALEHAGAPLVGRVHGDLHYAQLLHSPGRVLVIDLEGDPTTPLAARRAADTPLRDVAALLRSIDHIGTAAARRVGEVGSARRPAGSNTSTPEAFIQAASAAALGAYEARTGAPVDRRMLRALELAAECRELVYAHRTVPEWAYAPEAGLRRLLQEPQEPEEHPEP